jgi:hypothetical protein
MAEKATGGANSYGYTPGLSDKDRANLQDKFGGPNPPIQITQDTYGNWLLATRTEEEGLIPQYFYVQPNGRDFSVASAVEIVRAYKSEYVKKGNLETLRKQLRDKGFLSAKEYETRDEAAFNNRLLEAATSHSVEQIQKFTLEGKTSFAPFSSWLTGRAASVDSSAPNAQRELTDKLNAGQDIDDFVMQMIGRQATSEEKIAYYDKLTTEQKKAIRKTTVSGGLQTTTGDLLDSGDRFRIMATVLMPSLQNTPLEDITKYGGRVASSIMTLKETAKDYGIELSTKDALDKVLNTFTTGGILDTGSLDGEKASIKELSKSFYKNLAVEIDRGVKVSDIAKQFASYKSKILETSSDAIDVFDKDIQDALHNNNGQGVMSFTDFQIKMRKDPRWSKTQNAREEASNYATDILRSFGLMA